MQERGPQRFRLHEASLSAGFGSPEILGLRLDAPLLQFSIRNSSFDWFDSSLHYSGPQVGLPISGQRWRLVGSDPNARSYLLSRAISVLGIAMLLITFAVVLAVNRIPMFGGNAGSRLRNAWWGPSPDLPYESFNQRRCW